ncbi:hypothetical protein [Carnobacterium maltaromaticum]|uniref:hypothetical protein n=1 Tax=Carnobacterium maltaromaticum TaxID=2751 RepID=UPI001071FD7C|nr:hypothetical protein [Carnobacterium maltaromaticum]TFJ75335.1 hypothetical protein CKN94_06740 [Carnobacterium maltaromaticum]TFJ78503.1 hypothetical protein CKN97_06735 [Carnobacterium maltaromaticum]
MILFLITNFFFKKLNIEKKISFSKEIVWLYQTFRIPLDYYIFQIFLEIIEDIQILEKDLSKCHELLLFLLNEARLDCNMLEFKKIKSLLEKLNLLGNDKNEYDYQCILNAIDENKVNEALLLLREWKIVNHSLDYQLKKEILLIKYDKNQRELKNLKKLLENVRKIEMVDRNNYFILSIEGVILSILKKYEKDDTHDYFNRLIQLESSFCNPQTTIEYYSAINFESNEEITGKTHNFDGNIVVHQKFGNFDKASVNATFFLLMMYETYNLGLNENNTIEVLRTIQKYYPTFVLKKFLELGKLKEIEKFYSKQKIISFSSDQKDNLFHYLFEGINDFEGHNLKIYTEVMYRLYFVLDLKYQLRLDQFAIDLYTNSKLYEYYKFDIKEIFSKIFSRILVNKNWRDLDKYINKLFNLPLVGEINTDLEYVNLDENFTFDPLDFFEYNKKLMPLINIVSDKYEVECLLKYIKDSNIKISIRMGAWRRLLVLNATGSLLNKDYVHLKKEIKIILEKEQDILFNLYLPSFAVLTFVNEKEFTLAYFNKYMKREIPESFTPGVLMMGTGVKQYLDELRNLLLNRDYSYYEYQIVFEKIISWWDSQYELASKELKIKEYEYNNQDLKHIVVFLKNEILSKIKIENFSEENKFFFINCYEQLKKIDSELYLLLIPGIIKLKNNEEELLEILINGMTDSRSKFAKFAIVAMQDIANLKQKKEISINVRPSKEKLLQLLLVQKESTLKEITGVLCFVLKDHPSFFTKNELTEIKGSMNLFYQQFVVQKNQKVFSDYELIKIISNYVSMATALIENKLATVEEFKDWKNYCSETVFYEIKKYEYIFNKNEVTR